MANLQEFTFLPTEDHVKVLGRTFMLDDCRVLSLSGAGVEFKYTGTRLTVTFYGDSTTETVEGEAEPWRDQARVAVIIDGITMLDTVIKKPVEKFVVFGEEENAPIGEHVVRIIKLSEPRMSTVGLGEISVLATEAVSGTEYMDKYIEFIGDSITCGYGIDTPDEWYIFSTDTENVTKSFAYKTAHKLGADYSLVSYSGHGLLSGYTDDPTTPVLDELMQPYYEIFAYSYNTFRGMKLESRKWDYESERKPDVIVINLGTNDESYIQDDADKKAAFESAYVDFLEQVHNVNPKSTIVVAFGLMGDALFEVEERAVSKFKDKSGFRDVYAFRIRPQDFERNGYAADWHPSAASHEIAADELTEFLKTIM